MEEWLLIIKRIFIVQGRLEQIKKQLNLVVTDELNAPPTFRTLWSADDGEKAAAINRLPTRVRIDNDSADKFTLIDVFAKDLFVF